MMRFKIWFQTHQFIINFSMQIFFVSWILLNLCFLFVLEISIIYHIFAIFLCAFWMLSSFLEEKKDLFNFVLLLKKDNLTLIYIAISSIFLFLNLKKLTSALVSLILFQNYILLLFFLIKKIGILMFEKLWIKKYLNYFPTTVERVLGTEMQTIDKKKLQIGEIFYVKKNQIIPLDGVIIQGSALVQLPYEKDSENAEKYLQDEIIAGTKITEGSLYLMCKKSYSEQSFQKIIYFFKQQTKSFDNLQKFDFFVIFSLLFLTFFYVVQGVVWSDDWQQFLTLSFWILCFPFQAFSEIFYLKTTKKILKFGVLTSISMLKKSRKIKNLIFTEKNFYQEIWRLEETKTFNTRVDEVYAVLKKITVFDPFLQKIHWFMDLDLSAYRLHFVQIKNDQDLWVKEKNGDLYCFTSKLPKMLIKASKDQQTEISDSMPESATQDFQDLVEEIWQDEHQGQDFYLLKNQEIIAQFFIRPEAKKNLVKSLDNLNQKRKKIILTGSVNFEFTKGLFAFFKDHKSIKKTQKMIDFLEQKNKFKNQKTLSFENINGKNFIPAKFITIEKIPKIKTEKIFWINEDFFSLNLYLRQVYHLHRQDFLLFLVLLGIFCIFTILLLWFKLNLGIQIGIIIALIIFYLFVCSKIDGF